MNTIFMIVHLTWKLKQYYKQENTLGGQLEIFLDFQSSKFGLLYFLIHSLTHWSQLQTLRPNKPVYGYHNNKLTGGMSLLGF